MAAQAPGGRPSWAHTSDGRTPAEVAALAGCPELVEWLVAQGAARPAGEGADGFIAAVLAGDRRTATRLRAHAGTARAQRPALIVWAAARRKRDAIVLLAELGFDVNALGRTDVPMEQAWETALHEAAAQGDTELARLLLKLGAHPSIKDARFDATQLGWSRHFGQKAMIELLEPLTSFPPERGRALMPPPASHNRWASARAVAGRWRGCPRRNEARWYRSAWRRAAGRWKRGMGDRELMRASDDDRQQVVDRLRAAFADGRLKMEEFTERVELAYQAVTYGAWPSCTPTCLLPARKPSRGPPGPPLPRLP
jgi:Domain of unknown function (DUF1707)/Ankyrin repeat